MTTTGPGPDEATTSSYRMPSMPTNMNRSQEEPDPSNWRHQPTEIESVETSDSGERVSSILTDLGDLDDFDTMFPTMSNPVIPPRTVNKPRWQTGPLPWPSIFAPQQSYQPTMPTSFPTNTQRTAHAPAPPFPSKCSTYTGHDALTGCTFGPCQV